VATQQDLGSSDEKLVISDAPVGGYARQTPLPLAHIHTTLALDPPRVVPSRR
jgi:hypothetical protein